MARCSALGDVGSVGSVTSAVFDTMLPHAVQIADPFHVVKLANFVVDVRRRVQNDTLGHRGRKTNPLYRCRKLMTLAHERLDDTANARLVGLLEAGDRKARCATPSTRQEVVRGIYLIDDTELAVEFVAHLGMDLQDESCPPEVRRFGRTLTDGASRSQRGTKLGSRTGRTEAVNNLIKRVETRGVRDHELDQLPHPITALRRQAQLVAPRPQPTLKSEAPQKVEATDAGIAGRLGAIRLLNIG